MPAPPPAAVAAFGGTGTPILLHGGQGDAWRAGPIVLKPADDAAEPTLRWLDGTARPAARATDLRIALPLAARDGSLRVQGWSATRFLAGTRPRGAWHERADVARRFAAAFDRVDPAGLPLRDDPWAAADRATWGEGPGPLAEHPVSRVLRPLRRPRAIVHGDLAGNTLIDDSLPPAVIDLSVYARPVEWSVAVLAVDVVAFEGAPLSLFETVSEDPDFPQLLARALLFRMTTDVLLGAEPHAAYAPLAAVLPAMAEQRSHR